MTNKEGFLHKFPAVRDFSLILKMGTRPGAIIPSIMNVTTVGERLNVYSDFIEKVCFKCICGGKFAPYCRNSLRLLTQRVRSRNWAKMVLMGAAWVEEPPLVAV